MMKILVIYSSENRKRTLKHNWRYTRAEEIIDLETFLVLEIFSDNEIFHWDMTGKSWCFGVLLFNVGSDIVNDKWAVFEIRKK